MRYSGSERARYAISVRTCAALELRPGDGGGYGEPLTGTRRIGANGSRAASIPQIIKKDTACAPFGGSGSDIPPRIGVGEMMYDVPSIGMRVVGGWS